jgi:DNA-binding MarR family transcriptional regulator
LAQVGAQAMVRFAAMLTELNLTPPHAGILRAIASSGGISQQALATLLRLVPSRLVALLDELEAMGLLERRDKPEDRRVYALHLTAKGMHTMGEVARIARAHNEALCAPLDAKEREQLSALLTRIAESQNLTPGVHPGYTTLRELHGERRPDGPTARRPRKLRRRS